MRLIKLILLLLLLYANVILFGLTIEVKEDGSGVSYHKLNLEYSPIEKMVLLSKCGVRCAEGDSLKMFFAGVSAPVRNDSSGSVSRLT